jgi:hypothetical protein
VGIYGKAEHDHISALLAGAQSHGLRPRLLNPNFCNGEVEPNIDLVVASGIAGSLGKILPPYKAAGIPVLVFEQGHINRDEYFQFGHTLNWLPDGPCDDDRRQSLGIKAPRGRKRESGHVLVLGQKPGDAQHPMANTGMVKNWGERTIREIKRHTDRTVTWRPHPFCNIKLAHSTHKPDEVPFEESLKSAHSVVTWNSNGGLRAILEGIPTFTTDSSCWYREVCCGPLANIEDAKRPTPSKFTKFFNRVAYAQWNLEEIEDGTAWEFVLKNNTPTEDIQNDAPEGECSSADIQAFTLAISHAE